MSNFKIHNQLSLWIEASCSKKPLPSRSLWIEASFSKEAISQLKLVDQSRLFEGSHFQVEASGSKQACFSSTCKNLPTTPFNQSCGSTSLNQILNSTWSSATAHLFYLLFPFDSFPFLLSRIQNFYLRPDA